jgi:hypothetical protein
VAYWAGIVTLFAAATAAQMNTAEVSEIIKDPVGGPIPNAMVLAVNAATHLNRPKYLILSRLRWKLGFKHRIVDFRKAWASACERAGCPDLLFHDLRRSAVRNMRLSGLEESVAMRISGHRTRAVFDRYDIVGLREINEAAAKMENRLNKSLGTISGTTAESGTGDSKPATGKASARLLN